MINRLPSDPGSFQDLLAELGLKSSDAPRIARALGVSETTFWRWKRSGAPKTACLSLWWLSRQGHSEWDSEMHNRTVLALQLNESLWRRIGELSTKVDQVAAQTHDLRRPQPAANEPGADRAPVGAPLSLRSVGRGVPPTGARAIEWRGPRS